MNRRWKFYAVAGFNGYGVYNDYNKVLKAKKYINGFKVKSFSDPSTALRYAERVYYELQIQKYNITHPVYHMSTSGGMNWFYHMNPKFVKPFVIPL